MPRSTAVPSEFACKALLVEGGRQRDVLPLPRVGRVLLAGHRGYVPELAATGGRRFSSLSRSCRQRVR